jgi:hypothetical protein
VPRHRTVKTFELTNPNLNYGCEELFTACGKLGIQKLTTTIIAAWAMTCQL